MSKKQKFVIIDGNALIHRAFHALPPLTTKTGKLVNAVYGFTTILLKIFKELKPDYLAVAFDRREPTFRHKEFKEYKATRIKQPQELYDQIPLAKEVVKGFNIPVIEKAGYEADDIIGTLRDKAQKEDLKTIIVTGDLDTLQLVNPETEVYTLKKGISDTIIYNENLVKERYGLIPKQMIDFKALRGDPSDNIPGVRGIGEKGALDLIKEFGSLEGIYKVLEKKTSRVKKIKEKHQRLLQEHKKEAFLSQKLVTIILNVPFKFHFKESQVSDYNREEIIKLFQELEFKSLLTKIPPSGEQKVLSLISPFSGTKKLEKPKGVHYQLIDEEKEFERFLKELKAQKEFALDTETTAIDPFRAELLGISFSWQKGQSYFVIANNDWLKKLRPILENPKGAKYGQNLKYDLAILAQSGINLDPVSFDTMVASYLLNPGSRAHSLDKLVFSEFGHEMILIEELIGPKGKKQISMKEVPKEKLAIYASEDADFTFRLVKKLEPQLEKRALVGLFRKIEMPLIPVLVKMETNGVKIDANFLMKMGRSFERKISDLEKKIYQKTKTKFNIASPVQLKEVLFQKLKISTEDIGKTKTGYSTAASELKKLKGRHPVIDLIIQYREFTKLKSTYLDALPKLINPRTNRVHTSFNQTITATGRLSSSNPNLQNIPARTPEGQAIRKAFRAEKGFKLLSADYSQIELRIIASIAQDKKMMESFRKKEDIHIRTAAEIHEVALDQVTKNMRRDAKAVNFGVIYGMGVYGLAESTGISREKAKEFIGKYFEIHQGIKEYIDQTKALAHKIGYVETLFGRRRYLPEINSGVQVIKAQAERMAVNMPIQGTAADLMKIAMIEIDKRLPKVSKETKMILQVHDELVFEFPEKDLKKVVQMVEEVMTTIYKLRVPIEVEISVGDNWGELKEIKI